MGKTKKTENPLNNLQRLHPLDIERCDSLSELVYGQARCAFGAAMLGQAAEEFMRWTQSPFKPIVVYDGDPHAPVFRLLQEMKRDGLVDGIMGTLDLTALPPVEGRGLLVVDTYSKAEASNLHARPEQMIFVNDYDQCRPRQVKDGHFPNVVFTDPALAMPIIDQAVREWRGDPPVKATDFMQKLATFGGQASIAAQAAKVFGEMVDDPECKVMFTLSGAMTAAQMGGVIETMIRRDMVQAVTATGALMTHGLMQGLGLHHLQHDPAIPDTELVKWGGNRITTVIEPETNFDVVDEVVTAVLKGLSGKQPISPSQLHRLIGKYLHDHYPKETAIFKTAFEKKVPIFVPAFYDSELGNDVTVANFLRKKKRQGRIIIDSEADNRALIEHSLSAKKLGIFTVGGGVPRNWAQNLGPLVNLHNGRARAGYHACKYEYAVRIDPASMFLGHLSGCTYSEGTAWGKFVEKLRRAEVQADATIVWPLIVWWYLQTRADQ